MTKSGFASQSTLSFYDSSGQFASALDNGNAVGVTLTLKTRRAGVAVVYVDRWISSDWSRYFDDSLARAPINEIDMSA